MKHSVVLLSVMMAIVAPVNAQEPSRTVFDNTRGEVPYRIPAIATTRGGTLVAVADYRYCKADIGSGRVDLHVRMSDDNGASWSTEIAPSVMMGDGNLSEGNQKAAYGDPCIVADRESDKILVVSCSGSPGFFSGTRSYHQGWARFVSEDDGRTWSSPTYLDEEYLYKKFDSSQFGQVRGWFVGSGKIHQSRYVKAEGAQYYRLYCAGTTCSEGGYHTANWVLYSDDFGESWNFLGGCDVSPVDGGDEPKVEELPNGNVIISSRCTEGRYFNIFSFTDKNKAEGCWAKKALSSSANNGLTANNACNGEVGVYPVIRKTDGEKTWIILQSLPTSGRTHVTIFYKDLGEMSAYANPDSIAKDWKKGRVVSEIGSAYSTWSMTRDHHLAFLYEEEGGLEGGYNIVFKKYSIEDVTNGEYMAP